MPPKLSPHKVSKMMALYSDGYSQSYIANKLKINQSTVSLYVSKLKSIAKQSGIEAAADEFGVIDQVEALHSLAAELRKSKLTAEEARVGLKMVQLLQKLAIKQEDYTDIIQACSKMKSASFAADAVRLNKLENSIGMTHEQLVAQYASIRDHLSAAKEELAGIEKHKKLAAEEREKQEVSSLSEKKTQLEQAIAEREAYYKTLSEDIKTREQEVSQLKELESKREALWHNLSEVEAKLSQKKVRLQILESFLGFFGPPSLKGLEELADVLPQLLAEAKQGKYSPELLKALIAKKLTGDALQLLRCASCGATFTVDKPPKAYSSYHCPRCGPPSRVEIDQEGLTILKTVLASLKP